MTRADDGALEAGTAALLEGRWQEARSEFEKSLAAGETPEAWDGLASACRWSGDMEGCLHARERAYRLWSEAGEKARAAEVATRIGADTVRLRGDLAVANGWFARAERLLDGAG